MPNISPDGPQRDAKSPGADDTSELEQFGFGEPARPRISASWYLQLPPFEDPINGPGDRPASDG